MVVRALVIALALALAAAAIGLLLLLRSPATPVPRDAAAIVTPADAPRLLASMIDAAAPAARAEREAVMTTLAHSGIGDEAWAAQAGALFTAIAQPPVTVSVTGCYIAGCGATFTFASEADYRRTLAGLAELAAYRAWTGGKKLTNPETRSDGSVVVGLVLYRPD